MSSSNIRLALSLRDFANVRTCAATGAGKVTLCRTVLLAVAISTIMNHFGANFYPGNFTPLEAVEPAPRVTARDEIHKALIDLSRTPRGGLTGAIQHAMVPLECVARDVCGDERATFGEVINDNIPARFPQP